MLEAELSDDYGLEDSTNSHYGVGFSVARSGGKADEHRIQTLLNFGYPEDYLRYCLAEDEACYCMATYYLLGLDQRY